MTKHLFAVFAHPDDEAFGPSGTLLAETDAGTVLHLVLLTSGEHGINPGHDNLASVQRRKSISTTSMACYQTRRCRKSPID